MFNADYLLPLFLFCCIPLATILRLIYLRPMWAKNPPATPAPAAN